MKQIDILDSYMSYIEVGDGEPILFLHGNPTSSYLWRNIIPSISRFGRCIAPDLIGMGYSGKPEITYDFKDHYSYLLEFIQKLELTNITLVLHDWGSALGFHLLKEYPDKIKKVAFMEAILFVNESYSDLGEGGEMFRSIKTPEIGEKMILDDNFFLKEVLPGGIIRRLQTKNGKSIIDPLLKVSIDYQFYSG